jgi:hypothetical protein
LRENGYIASGFVSAIFARFAVHAQLLAFARVSSRANQAREHTLKLLSAHVAVFRHTPVEQGGRNVAALELALRLLELDEDHTLCVCEAIAHVGQGVLQGGSDRLSGMRHLATIAARGLWCKPAALDTSVCHVAKLRALRSVGDRVPVSCSDR